MKTMILTLVLSLMLIQLIAEESENYVVIGNETYFCDKVQPGRGSTKVYSGKKVLMKIPSSQISAYCQEGKLFERLPVLTRRQDTAGWAFMQYIASNGGYRLYRYCSNCTNFDPETGNIAPALPVYCYYIYRAGKFVSIIDEHDVKSTLANFGVKQLV